jgi:hypothetical protein
LRGTNAIRATGLLIALVGGALVGCSEASEPEAPRPKPAAAVDADVSVPGRPDHYRSAAVGVALVKPEDWVFLSDTSHPDPERWDERLSHQEILRRLVMPYKTPLVALAPVPEPRTGIDPVVRVFARPFRGLGGMPIEFEKTLAVAAANAQGRNARPDFAIEEGPVPYDVGGIPGASTRIRWSAAGEGGELLPVLERILYARRGKMLFWIELERPLAVTGDEEAFERILASLQLDPEVLPVDREEPASAEAVAP